MSRFVSSIIRKTGLEREKFWPLIEHVELSACSSYSSKISIKLAPYLNKTFGRAQDPCANGAWLSKLI